ncbi:MAG: chemoreceptor glutamine deamidase CheD [Steroidobacterales bacterium]
MNSPSRAPSPAPSQFDHIQRRFDARLDATVATLHPGDYYVATAGELIGTVLGSCVSACVRDSRLRIGGMNHFMLPVDRSEGTSAWGSAASASTRFGNVAMERLINEILKLGGRRADLEVKLVGGGKVLDSLSDVGARNIRFVKEYVQAEGFRVVGADLGSLYPRKVLYNPATGSAQVKRLARSDGRVAADETRYMRDIDATPVGGDIELF